MFSDQFGEWAGSNEIEKHRKNNKILVQNIEENRKRIENLLDELDEIKICVQYELNGKKIDYLPAATEDQLKVKPIYQIFEGWKSSTKGIKNLESLPSNAKKYIFAVEDFIGAKISSIYTSPKREDTILIENPFDL